MQLYKEKCKDFDEYKQEQAIKDLLVVKFDIDAIDEDMLTAKDTKIEDLEQQKLELEKRISEALKDLNLHVTNEKELTKKVHMFQNKCQDLEDIYKEYQDEAAIEIRQLKREK